MKLSKISIYLLIEIVAAYLVIIVGFGISLFLSNLAFSPEQVAFFKRLYMDLGGIAFLLTVAVPVYFMESILRELHRLKHKEGTALEEKWIKRITRGHYFMGFFEFLLHFSAYLIGILFMKMGPGISQIQVYQAVSASLAISITFAIIITLLSKRAITAGIASSNSLTNLLDVRESIFKKLLTLNSGFFLIVVFVLGFINLSSNFKILKKNQMDEILMTDHNLSAFFDTLDLENLSDLSRAKTYLTRFFRSQFKEFLLVGPSGKVLGSSQDTNPLKEIPFSELQKKSFLNYKSTGLSYYPDYPNSKIYLWKPVDGGSVFFVSVIHEDIIGSLLISNFLHQAWIYIGIILLGLLLLSYMAYDLIQPIRNIINKATRISEGDLTQPVPIETWDELLLLARAFENIRVSFQKITSRIRGSAEKMQDISDSIAEATNQEASAVVEYASSVNEVLATLEELAQTSKKVSDSAAGVSGLTEKNLQKVEDSNQIIQEYFQQSQQIEDQFEKNVRQMKELNKKIQDISRILELIENISGETKILSINASIESARSGDNGRGFGVVASEIRKLTDRVVNSTSTIRQYIREVQNLSDETMSITQKTWEGLQKQLGSIEIIRDSFDEILQHTENVSEVANHISESIQQQSIATHQVRNTMEEISQVIRDSSEMIQRTKNQVQDFNILSTEFLNLVAVFKFNQEDPSRSRQQESRPTPQIPETLLDEVYNS
ncbi:MAG: methyl-accepting chemotaxis protein [Calditrichaeota bacterium]|nr:methyl-accepting chemotaxis protein [Calditrichota bacterium]